VTCSLLDALFLPDSIDFKDPAQARFVVRRLALEIHRLSDDNGLEKSQKMENQNEMSTSEEQAGQNMVLQEEETDDLPDSSREARFCCHVNRRIRYRKETRGIARVGLYASRRDSVIGR